MKQYCRYCGNCIDGDCYYCTEHEKVLTESAIRHTNNCPDYADIACDVFTGERRKVRKSKPVIDMAGQMRMNLDEVSE